MTPEREAKFARHMAKITAPAEPPLSPERQKLLTDLREALQALAAKFDQPAPLSSAISAIHDSRKRSPTEWVEVKP
jgi:hypothetical protein